MSSQELLETYGKAASVVKEFYLDKFLESLNTNDLPDNFKEFAREQGIDNDTVAKMIDAMPRALFDVFDANGINIVIHVYTEQPPTEFAFSIPQDNVDYDQLYPTRKEAEAAAIEKAFEILNEKLCQTKQ